MRTRARVKPRTTLLREGDLRIVVIVMKAGARMKEHRAQETAAIQGLSGHVRLHLPDETTDVRAGQLLVLEGGIQHDVEAVLDSALLLTLGWPPGSQQAQRELSGVRTCRPRTSRDLLKAVADIDAMLFTNRGERARQRWPLPSPEALIAAPYQPAGVRGGTSENAMTKAETMMPFRRVVGS